MFIKGLSFSADEGSVQAVFPAAYQVRIPLNEEGRPKGVQTLQGRTLAF